MKRANGYNNLAQEVMLMTELARKSWSAISSKTPLTLEELARADAVADRLVKAAGEKEQLKPVVTSENDTRRRAYTLLLNAYDAIRSAISYVRWDEDDIDEIAPSLWSAKVRRTGGQAGGKARARALPRSGTRAATCARADARTDAVRVVGHAR